MKKLLFERYAKLGVYRLVAKELLRKKAISRGEYININRKIERAEMELIIPKRTKAHPRTLMRVK
ncbi:hypothetical protein IKE71_03065 [Candidatus Saccharibacteria bacterium]|nr:hypothetical protein [Candidatus Saccharibacteria bacterium]